MHNRFVPTYGNWGGPGYSGGRRPKHINRRDRTLREPVDEIDELFMEHDFGYEDEAYLAADQALIQALERVGVQVGTYPWAAKHVFRAISAARQLGILDPGVESNPGPRRNLRKEMAAWKANGFKGNGSLVDDVKTTVNVPALKPPTIQSYGASHVLVSGATGASTIWLFGTDITVGTSSAAMINSLCPVLFVSGTGSNAFYEFQQNFAGLVNFYYDYYTTSSPPLFYGDLTLAVYNNVGSVVNIQETTPFRVYSGAGHKQGQLTAYVNAKPGDRIRAYVNFFNSSGSSTSGDVSAASKFWLTVVKLGEPTTAVTVTSALPDYLKGVTLGPSGPGTFDPVIHSSYLPPDNSSTQAPVCDEFEAGPINYAKDEESDSDSDWDPMLAEPANDYMVEKRKVKDLLSKFEKILSR